MNSSPAMNEMIFPQTESRDTLLNRLHSGTALLFLKNPSAEKVPDECSPLIFPRPGKTRLYH